MDLRRTSLVLFISKTLSKIIGFAGTVYFARQLGPETMGVFALFQSIIGIAAIPADFGVQDAAEKRISETDNQSKQAQIMTASIIITIVAYSTVGAGLFLISGPINQYIGERLVFELIFVLFLNIIYQLLSSVLRAQFEIEYTAIIDIIQTLVRISVTIVLIISGFGILSLIYGILTATLISILLSAIRLDYSFELPTIDNFNNLFQFSKYTVILNTSGLIYTWIDTLMIGFFLNQSLVGIYEVSWTLTSVIALAGQSISQVAFPNFSNLISNGKIDEVSTELTNSIVYALVIPIPAFFGILLLSKDILSIIYGSEFAPGWIALILLAGERAIHSFHSIIYQTLLSLDHPDAAFRISVATMLFNVVLNAILVPILGIAGAALAFLIAYSINTAAYAQAVTKYISIDPPLAEVGWMVVSSLLMAGMVYGYTIFDQVNSVSSLVLVITGAVVVYSISLLLNPDIRSRILLEK